MTLIDPARLGTLNAARLGATGAASQAAADAARLRAAGASGTQPTGAAFRVAAEVESGAAEATIPLTDATPVALGVMLAAEALDRDPARDRAARRHGLVVLAGLTALQRALLEGGDLAVSLDRLAALLADMPPAVDPRLAGLLDTIALRVRVELARLGR